MTISRVAWVAGLVVGAAVCAGLVWLVWNWYVHTQVPVATDYVPPSTFVITHRAEGQTHTYSGVLDTRECNNLNMSYTAVGGAAPSLELRIVVVRVPGCTFEGRATRPFSVSLQSASSTPTVTALSINGVAQEFTIIEDENSTE